MRDILRLARCFARLWWSAWPQLIAIAALGTLASDLLMPLAVDAGYVHGAAGFALLSVVVLLRLVVIVLMFLALRPYLPAVAGLQVATAGSATPARRGNSRAVIALVSAALIPFFGYYAAWGFLSDTIRDYSLLALHRRQLGQSAVLLDVPTSTWLIVSVALSWGVRRAAKAIKARNGWTVWDFLIVLCDANWIFIGLYVLSRWKDAFWAWIAAGGPLPWLVTIRDTLLSFIGQAQAAVPAPVDFAPLAPDAALKGLFFYALLPLVWLLMAAVVYGYNVTDVTPLQHQRAAAVAARYGRLPKFMRDFIEHFVAGYRGRYLPVVNSVRLAFGASLSLLLAFMISYRLIGWLGAWSWIGLIRLIGERDIDSWQLIANVASFFLGGPSDIRGGILIEAARVCLLAAVMEVAVSAQRKPGVVSVSQTRDSADAPSPG